MTTEFDHLDYSKIPKRKRSERIRIDIPSHLDEYIVLCLEDLRNGTGVAASASPSTGGSNYSSNNNNNEQTIVSPAATVPSITNSATTAAAAAVAILDLPNDTGAAASASPTTDGSSPSKSNNNNNNNSEETIVASATAKVPSISNSAAADEVVVSKSDTIATIITAGIETVTLNGIKKNSDLNLKKRDFICSVCYKCFEKGQALGGHMRRHYVGPPIGKRNKNVSPGGTEDSTATIIRDSKEGVTSAFSGNPSSEKHYLNFDLNLLPPPESESESEEEEEVEELNLELSLSISLPKKKRKLS